MYVSAKAVPRQTGVQVACAAFTAVLHPALPSVRQMAPSAVAAQASSEASSSHVLHAEVLQTTCCASATAQSGRPMTSAAHAAMFGDTESAETGINAGIGVVAGFSP
jgi:uncharacterized protein (DUF1501 family)